MLLLTGLPNKDCLLAMLVSLDIAHIYLEFGWSLYEHTDPDEYNKIMSVLVENTRHPHWN
jgi:hypothetical protein